MKRLRFLLSWSFGCALAGGLAVLPLAAAAPVAETAGMAASLRQQLDAHVGQARFAGALWGIQVVSLDSGRTLYEHQAGRLMSPASNSKLYTGALALDRFGGDHHIVTPLEATARPEASGRLAGDVIVRGRGDPSWKARPRRGDFWSTFEPFVAALKKAGVTQVTGDVVADATFFRMPPYGAGWTVDDMVDDYGAEISAITLEENFIDVRVTPAAQAGQPCALELQHPFSGLLIRNRTTTAAARATRSIHSWRAPGERVVYLFGELPLGGAEEMLDLTVPQPATWFAVALKEALARAGIRIEGAARSVRWPEPAPAPESAVRLGEIVSPPLREIVKAFMKPSQNLETDLVFAQIGEAVRPAGAPEWRTSEYFALDALREFLRRNGLPVDEVRFDEGSGLSRNNLVSAHATVELLRFMAAHREAAAFVDSLPVAGVDGTLRRRMRATAAEGNVRAKTGTLRWASSISGYVTTAAGERLAFSVMLNRSVTPPGRLARDDIDAVATMLATLAERSDRAAAK